ncbi:hypothetical protein AAY473_038718 [Plecturocebus cupreus]
MLVVPTSQEIEVGESTEPRKMKLVVEQQLQVSDYLQRKHLPCPKLDRKKLDVKPNTMHSSGAEPLALLIPLWLSNNPRDLTHPDAQHIALLKAALGALGANIIAPALEDHT